MNLDLRWEYCDIPECGEYDEAGLTAPVSFPMCCSSRFLLCVYSMNAVGSFTISGVLKIAHVYGDITLKACPHYNPDSMLITNDRDQTRFNPYEIASALEHCAHCVGDVFVRVVVSAVSFFGSTLQ